MVKVHITGLTVAMAATALMLSMTPSPAQAEVQYGPWQQTSDCRAASPPSGMFRGAVKLPQAGGGSGPARECKWVREVQDCPSLADKMRHPVICSKRRETSGYTLYPPGN